MAAILLALALSSSALFPSIDAYHFNKNSLNEDIVFPEQGLQPEDDETRIQTGKIVTEIPLFMVGLVVKDSYAFCTATLISPDRILTAAHCTTEKMKGRTMQAVLGLLDIRPQSIKDNEDNPKVSIIEFVYEDVVNGNWTEKTQVNDISIIKLKSPVKDIFEPITLSSRPEGNTRSLRAMGWGGKNCSEASPEALREADGTYVNSLFCLLRTGQFVQASKLCVTYKSEGAPAAVAPGDSGGPLFSLEDPDEPIQIGIASYVFKQPGQEWIPGKWTCSDKSKPQVYTRVASFRKFIEEHAPEAEFTR